MCCRYHSHPIFAPTPSQKDNENQSNQQKLHKCSVTGLEPCIGAIVGPYDQTLPSEVSLDILPRQGLIQKYAHMTIKANAMQGSHFGPCQCVVTVTCHLFHLLVGLLLAAALTSEKLTHHKRKHARSSRVMQASRTTYFVVQSRGNALVPFNVRLKASPSPPTLPDAALEEKLRSLIRDGAADPDRIKLSQV